MKGACVHIIGAGLAGLSAAVALAGKGVRVVVSEAAGFAGGRCRSYYEPALQRIVDNGNHLILSGNRAAWAYVRTIGGQDNFIAPPRAEFAFAEIGNDERWCIAPNDGAFPTWIFSKRKRVPGTTAGDYLRLLPLMRAGAGRLGAHAVDGALWERLLHPILLAALNTEPETASRTLVAAIMRETLAAGGKAYKPRIANPTLAAAFIDPAIAFLKERGAEIRFGQRLHGITFEANCVATLEFPQGAVQVDEKDNVILAVPAPAAASLLPGISTPDDFRAIVSGHFGIAPPAGTPPMIGIIGGTIEWIFSFPDRVSVTISNADRLVDRDRAELADIFWRETSAVLNLPRELPPWQIVKEKRATFAATPEQDAKRASAETPYRNLFLAGDWTQTGLPATIEGAVRSGNRAAELALAAMHV
jgi:squalene-associated FAD-dependent desaturase